MIGTSGPSISMMALSTPRPASAASTCSAVEQSGPVGIAEHGGEFGRGDGADVGAISRSGWPPAPQRTKTMPVSASAGSMVNVAGDPECTPMPLTAVWWRSVVCLPAFMPICTPVKARAREACSPSRTRKVLILPKMPEGIVRGSNRRPPPPQQKSPLSANNLAQERIAATHAFLPSVTAKTPQSCPIRDTREMATAPCNADDTRPAPSGSFARHIATRIIRNPCKS